MGLFVIIHAEEEPPKRGILARKNIGGRPGPLNKPSTTTTTEAAYEEAPEGEEDYSEPEEKVETIVTTSTETPKKVMLIRPFRSNDDLLATLKKRRLQSKLEKPVTEKPKQNENQEFDEREPSKATEALHKPTKTAPGKKRFGSGKVTRQEPKLEEATSSAATPPLTERLGRSRFNLNRKN